MKHDFSTHYRSKPARADSEIDLSLPTQDGKQRLLQISTYKIDRTLVTRAHVMTVDACFRSHMLHGDFSQRLRAAQIAAIERNVRAQHESALGDIDQVLRAVREHYAEAGDTSIPMATAAV